MKRSPIFYLALVFVAYIALTFVFGLAPRGSDQYWNVGNVNRVIHIDGRYKTNNIFAASLPADTQNLPRPWVQNRPVVYFVTMLAFITQNAQVAWLVANLIMLFCCCLLLNKIFSAEPNSARFAILTAFLLFPLNYYLVMQALPEMANELLVTALFAVLIFNPDRLLNVSIAAVLSGLLIFQRDNFILLAGFIPVYFLVFNRKGNKLPSILVFLGITLLLYLSRTYFFAPHTVQPISSLGIINEVKPGKLNMVNYLYTDFPERSVGYTINAIFTKAIATLKSQFGFRGGNAIFFYLINILLLPFLVILMRYKKLSPFQQRGVFLTAIFVVLHFVTIILFENQYRFSSILIPLLFTTLYWFINLYEGVWKRSLIVLVYAGIAFFVVINIIIGRQNRSEARDDDQLVKELKEVQASRIGDKPVLANYSDGKSLIIAYGVSPNLCYYFPADASVDEIKQVAAKLGTDLFIVPGESGIYNNLKPFIEEETTIDEARRLVLLKLKTVPGTQ
jgi:hypothetical protein